ncbi:DUF2130 domain-containing protein [Mucilaginibacter daejeonensis]|uniref:DUF2130 domain-containing protein n=1 Tax=Mucilaginibacter daejeonensis TaxID=398049 RepID=UPI001D1783AF|nr:DUF2130 domain-containing protein [Mucilaginibacter daejeonensis]UEG54709.1 DUF2130 domain-containing protein [Mucilaginibacter daejeonensis]
MATEVKCPNCGHGFPIEEVMTEEYKKQLRNKMQQYTQQKEEEYRKNIQQREDEYRKKEDEFNARQRQQQQQFDLRLADEKRKVQQEMEEALRRSIQADVEHQMRLLENSVKEQDEKLRAARQKELEYMQKERDLKQREEELELITERKLQEQREALAENIRKQEAEKFSVRDSEYQFKVRELEKQLDDQKRLAEEMKRKAEQGSMQLQGEVQELMLEEQLRGYFPFDMVNEVGKGIRGADCIQTVRNQFGHECGKIIYESKRTKEFGGDWIEKLKKDMRHMGADIAVIVTQCYPKDMECFGEKDGVWICSFNELKAVSYVLRAGIMKTSAILKAQEGKGDKMHLLYDYLMSSEFNEQWKALREGFTAMRLSIHKEREAMEKLWKMREKQLEKVLLSAVHIQGSIEGIAGSDNISLSLTDDEDMLMLG